MTNLSELLEQRGIRNAVMIDDVFDDEPRPDELSDEDWSIFFDDLREADTSLLAQHYPEYNETPSEDLKQSQEFISILWEYREHLSPNSRATLFNDYESTSATERESLDNLVTSLTALGLTCSTMGREIEDGAREADLIFVDLFLGFQQSENDIDRAIKCVEELLKDRENTPPLVVLMSRSPRLYYKRNDFRDRAGLLGSVFRVVSKTELAEEGKLERILTRLANHYEDAKRVAGFIHAWNSGLDQARENFIKVLRRLDLSDLAQIRALLLDHEGQNIGDYLLDVSDRVLQHEIESYDKTIAAARELNNINLDKYPAPHLAGSPDLQNLVHRMVFLHPKRLLLSQDNGQIQLQFGDVLRWKSEDGTALSDDVSLVVTPACDLVRDCVERIMLLSGKLLDLEPRNWSYKATPVRTAIIELPNEGRKWIRWNLKCVKTITWDEIEDLFNQSAQLIRIGRLREIYAIEIQQMLLADFGRVGSPANMPAPFAVDVSLYYADTDSKAKKLDVKEIEFAVCYVGRDSESKPVHRLILTEQTCDNVELALQALPEDNLHQSAKASLSALKRDSSFFTKVERGEIEVSPEEAGEKKVQGADNNIYAIVVRGGTLEEGSPLSGNQRKAALIIRVIDIENEELS